MFIWLHELYLAYLSTYIHPYFVVFRCKLWLIESGDFLVIYWWCGDFMTVYQQPLRVEFHQYQCGFANVMPVRSHPYSFATYCWLFNDTSEICKLYPCDWFVLWIHSTYNVIVAKWNLQDWCSRFILLLKWKVEILSSRNHFYYR